MFKEEGDEGGEAGGRGPCCLSRGCARVLRFAHDHHTAITAILISTRPFVYLAPTAPTPPLRTPLVQVPGVRQSLVQGKDWKAVAKGLKEGHFGAAAKRMARERMEALVRGGEKGSGRGVGGERRKRGARWWRGVQDGLNLARLERVKVQGVV